MDDFQVTQLGCRIFEHPTTHRVSAHGETKSESPELFTWFEMFVNSHKKTKREDTRYMHL